MHAFLAKAEATTNNTGMATGAVAQQRQNEVSYTPGHSEPVPTSGTRARVGTASVVTNVFLDEIDERRPAAVEGLFWVLRGYAVVGLLAGVAWLVWGVLTP